MKQIILVLSLVFSLALSTTVVAQDNKTEPVKTEKKSCCKKDKAANKKCCAEKAAKCDKKKEACKDKATKCATAKKTCEETPKACPTAKKAKKKSCCKKAPEAKEQK